MTLKNQLIKLFKKHSEQKRTPTDAALEVSERYQSTGITCEFRDHLIFTFAGNSKIKYKYPFSFTAGTDFINDGCPSIRNKTFKDIKNLRNYIELKKALDDLYNIPQKMEREFNDIISMNYDN